MPGDSSIHAGDGTAAQGRERSCFEHVSEYPTVAEYEQDRSRNAVAKCVPKRKGAEIAALHEAWMMTGLSGQPVTDPAAPTLSMRNNERSRDSYQ